MKNIVEIYCIVDEVVKKIDEKFCKKEMRGRKNMLNKSELITIALIGHFESIPTDKLLYEKINSAFQSYFRNIPCYEQFTRGIRSISKYLDPLLEVLCQMNMNPEKDFYIIDSTALPVNGYNKNECAKWACDEAKLGKNIFGYYHGFKLHIIINCNMEIVSFLVTTANVHDVKALSINSFIGKISGILVGDKGYIANKKIIQQLKKQNLELIFKQRKNMDPYLNEFYHPQLRKRQIIEGVFSYLKNRLNALHKFARSTESFLVHVKAALAAFMLRHVKENFVAI